MDTHAMTLEDLKNGLAKVAGRHLKMDIRHETLWVTAELGGDDALVPVASGAISLYSGEISVRVAGSMMLSGDPKQALEENKAARELIDLLCAAKKMLRTDTGGTPRRRRRQT